ncbi:hypothetical protein FACS1894152_7200 [Bacilli bacterium]|nr:hypothetical protein FACS1894152_7200 [Bacilli bacterium]
MTRKPSRVEDIFAQETARRIFDGFIVFNLLFMTWYSITITGIKVKIKNGSNSISTNIPPSALANDGINKNIVNSKTLKNINFSVLVNNNKII